MQPNAKVQASRFKGPYFAKLVGIPSALIACAMIAHATLDVRYQPLCDLLLFSTLTIDIATIMRGRRAQTLLIAVYSLSLGLSAVEALSLVLSASPIASVAQAPGGLFASRQALGWGPVRPGTVRETKVENRTGKVIYDVDYTINADLLRKTVSAENGPTVAFFGDSWIFGEGVEDSETLPQVFADLNERRLRVLNLGFLGYGPEQFLRAVETGIFDHLLRPQLRLVVFTTFADQIRRATCKAPYVLRAPHYVFNKDGEIEFAGPCTQGLRRAVLEFAVNTAFYQRYIQPFNEKIYKDDVALYIATVLQAAALVKAKYNVSVLIVYDRVSERDFLQTAGVTNDDIISRFREGGVQVLDMNISEAIPTGTPDVLPIDGHPTAAAQAARAKVLERYLAGHMPDLIASP